MLRYIERKTCSYCTRSKPATKEFFDGKKSGKYGLDTYCKICRDKRKKLRDPRIDLLNSARKSAKDRNLEFSITLEDISIPSHCPILGIKLFKTAKQATNNSPSIDRIDSSKGYIKGNVQILSLRANILKNNATVDELESVLNFIRK